MMMNSISSILFKKNGKKQTMFLDDEQDNNKSDISLFVCDRLF